jgi:hypothetical protein
MITCWKENYQVLDPILKKRNRIFDIKGKIFFIKMFWTWVIKGHVIGLTSGMLA